MSKIQIKDKDGKGNIWIGCLQYSTLASGPSEKVVWVGGMGFLARYYAKTATFMDSAEKFNKGMIQSMVYVNDQMWCASSDSIISIFDGFTGKLSRVLEGHMGRVFSLVVVGDYVWSSSWDKHILIWNTATYTCSNFLSGSQHKDSITCLTAIHFKRRVPEVQVWAGSASKDGYICVYKITSMPKIKRSMSGDVYSYPNPTNVSQGKDAILSSEDNRQTFQN